MFFAKTDKIEIATDKEQAQALLDKGWMLYNVLGTNDGRFIFLLGWYGEPRDKVFKRIEEDRKRAEERFAKEHPGLAAVTINNWTDERTFSIAPKILASPFFFAVEMIQAEKVFHKRRVNGYVHKNCSLLVKLWAISSF